MKSGKKHDFVIFVVNEKIKYFVKELQSKQRKIFGIPLWLEDQFSVCLTFKTEVES